MPQQRRSRTHSGRRIVAFPIVVVAVALLVGCGSNRRATSAPTPDAPIFATTVTPAIQAPPTIGDAADDSPATTAAFPRPAASAQLDRLIIPTAKVDAPIHVKGVNGRNEMESPDGKDSVAWYDFSARPGFGSNAVLSGHVDWYTGQRGVFWYLRNLKEGDDVIVRLTDGTALTYRVAATETVRASDAPINEIIGPTIADALTLITCDGAFSRSSQDYDKRRVVRAHRVS